MDHKDKIRIQEVIQFLIDNEQYGDNWKEHIDILQKVYDEIEDESEMPEGGWECSECGAPVNNMNDYCSRSCFNAGMR